MSNLARIIMKQNGETEIRLSLTSNLAQYPITLEEVSRLDDAITWIYEQTGRGYVAPPEQNETKTESYTSADTCRKGGNHEVIQHRDGKLPWCNTCGRTDNNTHHSDLLGLFKP